MCILSLLHSSLVLFIFGRVSPLEVSLAGRVIFAFRVGLRCVECRSGTIYLSASLGWVAGLYRFSYFGLCCGGYGTIEIVGGGPFFLAVFSFAVCSVGRWLSVVGLHFLINNFFSYSGIIYRSRIL